MQYLMFPDKLNTPDRPHLYLIQEVALCIDNPPSLEDRLTETKEALHICARSPEIYCLRYLNNKLSDMLFRVLGRATQKEDDSRGNDISTVTAREIGSQ